MPKKPHPRTKNGLVLLKKKKLVVSIVFMQYLLKCNLDCLILEPHLPF